jgi:CRISPR-associated protein Csc3
MPPSSSEETKEDTVYQVLLRSAVPEGDPVLRDFVDALAPKILATFAAVPALGGSGNPPVVPGLEVPAGLATFSAEEYERFNRSNPDQSMSTHVMNGVFAAMTLASRLPASKALSDDERRLWILGYVCHDYTKIYGLKVPAGDLPTIRTLIRRLGDLLDFDAFLPGWAGLLDDVCYLAQNTQTKQDSNLDISSFGPKTNGRTLETMRMLSSIADVLVHVKSPSEVVISPPEHRTAENLREKLMVLFGAERAPRLTYHKLSEVRGLLSNLINNGVMQALEAEGCEPFLFFPNGVVYLLEPGKAPMGDLAAIREAIWQELARILTSDEAVLIKRDGKGLKVAPLVYELMDVDPLLHMGQEAALRINNSRALERIGAARAEREHLATDLRVDHLAEFLGFVKRRIFDELFPKAQGVAEALLSALGLQEENLLQVTQEQSGGVPSGWWVVAAKYVSEHPTMDEDGVMELLDRLTEAVEGFIGARHLRPKETSALGDAFGDYLRRILELDPVLGVERKTAWAEELGQYVQAKATNKSLCSLCSSPYTAEEQAETAVPFVPQQYSNKTRLGSNKVRRGICPICTLEMMLRLVQQRNVSAKGGHSIHQDDKPIYLWIYPTYFFTAETARVVRKFIFELKDLNIFELRRHLAQKDSYSQALLSYKGFLVQSESDHAFGIYRQKYSEHDAASLFGFALHPIGKGATDTDSWTLPTLYAIALPLLLDVKVVASPSFVPLFGSGADFPQTVVLDAPHSFTRYVLGRDRFHVDELPGALERLLRLYDIHVDVFAERTDLHWPQVNALAKDVATDPKYVFYYYDHKKRKEENDTKERSDGWTVDRYMKGYLALGGEKDMGMIGELVDGYAAFYRGGLGSAYGVLKPLSEAVDAIMDSSPDTQREDLILMVGGAVGALMERVWRKQAEGWDPIVMVRSDLPAAQRYELSRQKQAEFARLVADKLFYDYCEGDRGLLRERLNRVRSAARFYYLSKYAGKKAPETLGDETSEDYSTFSEGEQA